MKTYEDPILQMFKDLTETPGIPGNESAVHTVMKNHISPYADEVSSDRLGSLIARKSGTADDPKIMIAGHLDEIGFMVTQITKDGFLKVNPVGFWWEHVMLAQQVRVITSEKEIPGVFGFPFPDLTAPDRLKKMKTMNEMFVDIGAEDREEAMRFGVRPGDMVVPHTELTVMENPNLLMAKAWDNRIGCAIAVEVMKRLKDEVHPNTLYSVGTVQEEVQARGARTSTNQIMPDIMFAVDVNVANDVPGGKPTGKLGDGPQIIMLDRSMIGHKGLRDFVIDVAESEDIPYQLDTISIGYTDARSSHLTGKGVPSLVITVPTRYIHSHSSILHRQDFEHAVELFVSVLKKLDAETVKHLTYS